MRHYGRVTWGVWSYRDAQRTWGVWSYRDAQRTNQPHTYIIGRGFHAGTYRQRPRIPPGECPANSSKPKSEFEILSNARFEPKTLWLGALIEAFARLNSIPFLLSNEQYIFVVSQIFWNIYFPFLTNKAKIIQKMIIIYYFNDIKSWFNILLEIAMEQSQQKWSGR